MKVAEALHLQAGTAQADRRPHPPITCGGCDATWTGTGRAHCSASGCHRTFATAALFDRHRSAAGEHGTCLDPETLVNRESGERLMFHRDGMWRSPEMTEEQKAKAFGGRRVA
jgi:hypothetical protein